VIRGRRRLFGHVPATIGADHPERVLAAAGIAAAVGAILSERLSDGAGMDEKAEEMVIETSYAALEPEIVGREGAPGELTAFSCPECGGADRFELMEREARADAAVIRDVLLRRDGHNDH
jgi:hypothetical protein